MLAVLLILIFIRPFVSSLSFIVSPYENLIYSTLLFGFLVAWITLRRDYLKEINPVRGPLVLFVLALLISLIFSKNKIISVMELYDYAICLLLFLAVISLSVKDKDKIILCIIVCALLISLYSIRQYLIVFPSISAYISRQGIADPFILDYVRQKRVFSPFVTPNALGGYLAMIIPLCLNRKKRTLFLVPLLFALLLTRSLGALLGLSFGLIIYFYISGRQMSSLAPQERNNNSFVKRNLFLLMGISVIIGLVFISRVTIQKQHLQPAFSTMMRLNYWKDTWEIIKISPLSGLGLGNFNLAESRYAHNSYLQIWAEMGILGVISFFWLVITIIKNNKTAALLAANAAFLAHNFVDFTFFLPEVAMLWWAILGLTLSKNKDECDNRNPNL